MGTVAGYADDRSPTTVPDDSVMMFKQRFHEPIRSGEITCTVRIWQRRHVKVGGRYRLGDGEIEVSRVSEIDLTDVTPALARASGFGSVAELLRTAKHGPGERVFLIEFRYLGLRQPPQLPQQHTLDAAERADLVTRLDRLDTRADCGPWTHATLRLIGRQEGCRAAELAQTLERPRDELKRDIRKLKRLGLTVSLEVGYSLSPRGRAFLAAEDE